MKKKLIALVLLFALFFSIFPQVAEAKTKQEKLDYSNMPYLDTLIYNKDYKNFKYFGGARKYLKLLLTAILVMKLLTPINTVLIFTVLCQMEHLHFF